MMSGWSWAWGEASRHPLWHFFRSKVSMCSAWIVDELTPDELEPEKRLDSERHYCCHCQKVLDAELRKGLPPEPALDEQERGFIVAHWATHTAAEIAQMLGRKNVDRIREWASSHCEKKEQNKGQFRKGDISHTAKPDLAESVRKDKRGVSYLHVRGGKWGWQYKHTALWEEAHGPVPKGHVVAFKNGDTLDCHLENLELITRAEHLERNSGRKELTDAYVARRLAQKGRGQVDRVLQEVVLHNPELIETKRNHLRLNRLIKPLRT